MESTSNSEMQTSSIHGLNENEVRIFVANNSDYYITKWKSTEKPDKKVGWNWAAFLAGIFWIGYRKMYKVLFYFIGIFIIIDVLQYITNIDFNKVAMSVMPLTMGMLGNMLYFKHVEEKIRNIGQRSSDTQDEALKNTGGTSWVGVGISMLILIAYLIITIFLEIFIYMIIK